MMSNSEQKHSALGASLEWLEFLYQGSYMCDCSVFWIDVKIPQKYSSQAVWKIHPTELESGSTQRHQEHNTWTRSETLPHPKNKKKKPKHYCHKWNLILLNPSESRQAGLHPGWEKVPIPLWPCVLAPFMAQLTGTCTGMGSTAVHTRDPNCIRGPGVFCKNSHCGFAKKSHSEHKSFFIFPLHHLPLFPISFGKWSLS